MRLKPAESCNCRALDSVSFLLEHRVDVPNTGVEEVSFGLGMLFHRSRASARLRST